MTQRRRLDAEWLALNATREVLKLATGDMSQASYDKALAWGGDLYPELLGLENSLIRRERLSQTAKEFQQKAVLQTRLKGQSISAIDLLTEEIEQGRLLLTVVDKDKTRELNVRLASLQKAKTELLGEAHTENQLILRDNNFSFHANLPSIKPGRGYRDYELPNGNILRVRLLHPDRPEHITGADLIYERHDVSGRVSFVASQYKLWDEGRTLYLDGDGGRVKNQIQRLQNFICQQGLCQLNSDENDYRFPACAAFIRPTNKLQNPDQTLMSFGEHLPVCKIDQCKVPTSRDGEMLRYRDMENISLTTDVFQHLFNTGKVGSRLLTEDELSQVQKLL